VISVLILTFNEEANLARCLDAVSWCDDVLVLDSFSKDQTVPIAQKCEARVLQNPFIDFAQQRNHGLEAGALKHDWVLHLDADEIVTEELRAELFEKAAANSFPAFRLASKLMLNGQWLRYSGMFPAYQVRFGRKDRLRFKMVGHGQRETLPPDQVGTLRNTLLHYAFNKGLEDWYARHARYAAAEADEALRNHPNGLPWRGLLSSNLTERRRALKAVSVRLPCRPFLRFFYMYFLHLGMLDGPQGYRYCRMLSQYERMIVHQTAVQRRRLTQRKLQEKNFT
jgi:glycosyltransferase involved in cell wall biosynthesis